MTFLAIPPLLVDTYAGLRSVDRDLIEAGRGMGFRERQILARIELPIASSIIVGGFRTATLQVIATATIGAILGGGGLGRFIFDGLNQGLAGRSSIYAGAIMVAALAIGVDIAPALLPAPPDAPGAAQAADRDRTRRDERRRGRPRRQPACRLDDAPTTRRHRIDTEYLTDVCASRW